MKLLLDENLSQRLLARLADLFPDSEQIDRAGLRGRADSEIWDYAREHNLVLVSKDNDFRQLSVLRGPPPKVIWLSVGNAGTNTIAEFLRQNTGRIAEFGASPEESLLVLEIASDVE